MSQGAPYSARQQDLYYPTKNLDLLPKQRPKSDAELCAWMAWLAYCDQFPDFAFDRGKITQALEPLGFKPVGFFESERRERNGGTHCFVALHDDAVKENRLAVVTFRGTDKDDPRDLLDDVEVELVGWKGKGKVFEGFAKALAEVEKTLLPVVQAIDCRVLFTGHSLGAALATLLAGVRAPSALYTIGSPRVGDHDFLASLGGLKSFRYVDCCDVVTTLPPPLLGYEHLGDPLYIDSNRKIIPNPGDDFISSDTSRAAIVYFLQYGWKRGNVWFRKLADHAPINYVTAIAAGL